MSHAVVNTALNRASVPRPSSEAAAFHAALPGYAPTPLRELPAVATELGLGAVLIKDESDRLGLPAFKILGASWAVERALREAPDTRTLIAASAGNHGRAVARVAAMRGLGCRIFLPARSLPARRDAIAAEGAEVVVVDGDYERAVARAEAAGAERGALVIAALRRMAADFTPSPVDTDATAGGAFEDDVAGFRFKGYAVATDVSGALPGG